MTFGREVSRKDRYAKRTLNKRPMRIFFFIGLYLYLPTSSKKMSDFAFGCSFIQYEVSPETI